MSNTDRNHQHGHDQHGDDQPASPDIVMFFLGPDGQPIDEPPPSPRTLGDLFRTWREVLDVERAQEDLHRHRPVARPVQGTGRPGRHGYRDEIVVTLRSRPMDAVQVALDGHLFEPPLRWLRVEPDTLDARRYELTWHATIAERPGATRGARLRLYASPSLNVTVLSLFPDHPRAVARRRFLRRGLLTMNALRDRIDGRVDRGETVGSRLGALVT